MHQYRMYASICIAVLLCMCLPAVSQAAYFSDDFESGNLDKWYIGGRQLGTDSAGVVNREGSKVAELYHYTHTEITMEKDFAYNADTVFDFELEVMVTGGGGSGSDFYANSYVGFFFGNSTTGNLGWVAYGASTSTWPYRNDDADTTFHYNVVQESVMMHYHLPVSELLGQIEIDESQIDTVNMAFVTYGSGWIYDMRAWAWVDNVAVSTVPEPSGIVGLLGGAAGLCGCWLRRRR